MEVDVDMEAAVVEIVAGEMRGGAVMTGTGGEEEGGGAGRGRGAQAGPGPGAGETGGAGARRGRAGGRPHPRGAAAPRSARQSLDPPHLGGRRGGAGAGAKKSAQTSFLLSAKQELQVQLLCCSLHIFFYDNTIMQVFSYKL